MGSGFEHDVRRNTRGDIVISEGTADWLSMHVLVIYRERMQEHIKTFDQAAEEATRLDGEGVPFITREGALRLAEQFRLQDKDASEFQRALADLDGYAEQEA